MLDWKKRESLLSKFLSRKHTYHQDILSFCSFVYNNYLFLCSSVENSAFREIYRKSTGYLRGMYGKCLNNISRCSNPLRILREMLPSFTKSMINIELHKFFSIHLEQYFLSILALFSKFFCIFAN